MALSTLPGTHPRLSFPEREPTGRASEECRVSCLCPRGRNRRSVLMADRFAHASHRFTAMACLGRRTRVPGELVISTISNGDSNLSNPTRHVLLSIEYLTWHIFLLLARLRRNRDVQAGVPFALTDGRC
jgi:hypothetical protein